MLITGIEMREIRLPLLAPFETSFGITTVRHIILIRVFDSDGVEGWGECTVDADPDYSEEWTGSAWPVIETHLIPLILNREIENVDEAMTHIRGNRMAKGAIETACRDLESRRKNIPLWKMLGGTGNEIACGVSIGLQTTTDALLAKIEKELSAGYQRIKIKIKPGHDVELVRQVRKRYPEIPLMVDANSAYRLDDLALFGELDQYNLMMIEQPLAHDDIADHAQLQHEIKTPICLDESIRSDADARHAIELGACRIINLKLGRVGGHAQAARVERVCRQSGIPVWCGGMLESGIGRAHNIAMSTLPGFVLPGDVSASERYWTEDIIDPPVRVTKRGTIIPPSDPGLGFNVKLDMIEKLTVRKIVAPASRRQSRAHPAPASATARIRIRPLTNDELCAVEEMQLKVWQCSEREILPAIHMTAAREVGAILLGAFDGSDLVGFVYGFAGFEGTHRVLHSDMLAVLPEYRDRGVGAALKFAQRDEAIARGIDRITWTFDPLQIRNAHFNFAKLGVTADRYLPDFYGTTSSPLHRLGTDRLWVSWRLNGPRRTASRASVLARIDVPHDILGHGEAQAVEIRNRTRSEFMEAFARGMIASGFERTASGGTYLLESRDPVSRQ